MKTIYRIGLIIISGYLIVSGNLSHAQETSEYSGKKDGIYAKYPDARELIIYFHRIEKYKVKEICSVLEKFPQRVVDVYYDRRFRTINITYANGLMIQEMYEVINRIEPNFLRLTAKPNDIDSLNQFVRENNIEKKL